MGDDLTRGTVRATREITVNIHGEEFDVLVIPKKPFVNVDYTRFPEDDPFKRELNIRKLVTVDLDDTHLQRIDGDWCRLTEAGARHLLESL